VRLQRALSRSTRVVVPCVALSCSLFAKAPPPAAPEKCPPQTISLSFLASRQINPTPEGQSRPVVVRVYELKEDARLMNASFDQVWHDDKATLAEDVVKVQEVQVYPARRADLKIDRTDPVNHIAVVALFQAPKSRSWVSEIDLPPLPEAGKCGAAACTDDDEDCLNMSVQNPRFAFWVDDTKIDDGIEHLEDFPIVGPMKGSTPP
jgi:type VI secretion system protein VasD